MTARRAPFAPDRSPTPMPDGAARCATLGLDLTPLAPRDGSPSRNRARHAIGRSVITAALNERLALFDGQAGVETLIWDLPESARVSIRVSSVRQAASVCDSLCARGQIDLLATGSDLLSDAALWDGLQALRDQGLCGRVGVHAEPGSDAVGLAKRFKPVVMQAACGLLDQRLIADGGLETLAAMGIELHLRTALLHGLLFLPREALPGSLADVGPQVSRARRLMAEAGADPLQAALAFALRRPEAAAVLVEVGSVHEVKALAAAAAAPAPELDWPALALDHPSALNAEAELYRTLAA